MGKLKNALKNAPKTGCPCGSPQTYSACCQPLHDGQTQAADALTLMRSRYAAYAQRRADYLLATWHPTTRPEPFDLSDDRSQWLGLEVRTHTSQDGTHATVEFVARYRLDGRGQRLHEISRFVLERGRWFYVSGEHPD